MRLRDGRDWGLLFMPMVKLVSGGCGVAVAELLGCRWLLQELEMSSAAAKCSERKVRAGWVES